MPAMKKHKTVADFLKAQPPKARKVLSAVRALIKKAAPDAEEVISYGIPGYKMNGRTGVFFSGWAEHFSLYPVTDGVRAAMAKQIAPYQSGKGTLKFSYDEKLPTKLITLFVKVRHAEAHLLPTRKK
ncbi:MAG: DUF1801 domain-containing protein [Archangium sp.]|nr:DUF1801 domain-containing protein [Archangium sp.]